MGTFGFYYRWHECGRACLLLFHIKQCRLCGCIFHLIKQTKSELTLEKSLALVSPVEPRYLLEQCIQMNIFYCRPVIPSPEQLAVSGPGMSQPVCATHSCSVLRVLGSGSCHISSRQISLHASHSPSSLSGGLVRRPAHGTENTPRHSSGEGHGPASLLAGKDSGIPGWPLFWRCGWLLYFGECTEG